MSDWGDDDQTATPSAAAAATNDDWGNNDKAEESGNHYGGENRRGSGRGRGRGRGRGGFNNNRDNNDGESEFDREGGSSSGRGRGGGRGGFKRDFNNDGERPPRDFSDRPPRRNRDEDGENAEKGADGEDKPKREIYVPPEPSNDEAEIFSSAISAGINFDKFDNIEVSVTGNGAKELCPIENFKDSKLRDFLLENVTKSGYHKPTPIQKFAFPIINAKRDLMGCAQTGKLKFK